MFCRLFDNPAKIGFLNEYLYLCIIRNFLIQQKMRRLIVLTIAVMLVSLTSCGNFRDIKVTSVAIHNVSLDGFKAMDVNLFVEIDNPAAMLKLSDMEAIVKNSGKVIGRVTVDPFTLKARQVQVYDMRARMALEISLMELPQLLDKNFLDNSTVDITVKGQLRGGLSKTITKNDIPLKKLINYANEKK